MERIGKTINRLFDTWAGNFARPTMPVTKSTPSSCCLDVLRFSQSSTACSAAKGGRPAVPGAPILSSFLFADRITCILYYGVSHTPPPLHTSRLVPMPSRLNRRKQFVSPSQNHTLSVQLIVSETILPIPFVSTKRQELNGDVVEKAGGVNKNGSCGDEQQ